MLGSDFVYLNCWERILSVYLKLLGDVHVFFFFGKKGLGDVLFIVCIIFSMYKLCDCESASDGHSC